MILWTIMPEELVFGHESVQSPYEEIEYAGTKMMIEKVSENQCRIVRLISSDPSDYLRQEVQPGTMLTAKPSYEVSQL